LESKKNLLTENKKKLPGNFHYLMGCLRYPDECDAKYGTNNDIFIAVRVATYSLGFDDIVVFPFCSDEVMLKKHMPTSCTMVDYVIPTD